MNILCWVAHMNMLSVLTYLTHICLMIAGVLIYTDVMHQLLSLFLYLVGLWSFSMPLAACWGAASHSGQAGSWLRLTEPFRVLHLQSCFVQYLSEGEVVVMLYYNIHRNNCLFKPDILWVKEMERWIMIRLLSGEVLCISGRSNVMVFNRSAHLLQLKAAQDNL